MSHRTTSLEQALRQLGTAHRDGAFSADVRPYPWRTKPEVVRSSVGRFGWVRVAATLAAAAAVAVVFVWPSLFGSRGVTQSVRDGLASAVSNETSTLVQAEPVTTTTESIDCDYNGDGTVDGRDIQALVNRVQGADGDVMLRAEYLQQCLLGS